MVAHSSFELESTESVYGSFGLYKAKTGASVIMVLKSLKLTSCSLVHFHLKPGDVSVNLLSNALTSDNLGRNFLKYFTSPSEGSNSCRFSGFCI